MRFPSVSTKTDVRSRLSRGSVLVHTGHVQPVSGTPVDVPVPRNVIFISVFLNISTYFNNVSP